MRHNAEVVHEFVDGLFLLTVLGNFLFGQNFYGSVRAGDFAGAASCAPVLIVFIVGHDHFTTESFSESKRGPVVGVFLGQDFLVVREIITRQPHPLSQGAKRAVDVTEIIF